MISFQYNKTSLQNLEKQLKVRVRALPTIKNKESALRMEVKHSKEEVDKLEQYLEEQIKDYDTMATLWNEFDPTLVTVKDVELDIKKIAGVRVPILKNIDFEVRTFSLFNAPKWYTDGIFLRQELAENGITREVSILKLRLLEHARKKTTQKVNLFEKVQIPGYQDAILKIKRFMEDEENLSKSSQKIMRSHLERQQSEEERV
ncbi:MAG: V-type ATP synthase subunit D [Bacteroidales bacterium]|nr:V-type ATP synthase subunit D [Bacteroidales bacterium]